MWECVRPATVKSGLVSAGPECECFILAHDSVLLSAAYNYWI